MLQSTHELAMYERHDTYKRSFNLRGTPPARPLTAHRHQHLFEFVPLYGPSLHKTTSHGAKLAAVHMFAQRYNLHLGVASV
jgi:hypothetical protein